MAAFRAEFTHVVHHSEVENDLSSFWLRKSQKPVLAVLLVQKPGQPFKLYRGECELKIFALLFEKLATLLPSFQICVISCGHA